MSNIKVHPDPGAIQALDSHSKDLEAMVDHLYGILMNFSQQTRHFVEVLRKEQQQHYRKAVAEQAASFKNWVGIALSVTSCVVAFAQAGMLIHPTGPFNAYKSLADSVSFLSTGWLDRFANAAEKGALDANKISKFADKIGSITSNILQQVQNIQGNYAAAERTELGSDEYKARTIVDEAKNRQQSCGTEEQNLLQALRKHDEAISQARRGMS